MKQEGYFEAIAVLVGTVIGAGVLGIPYVVAKAGFITGAIMIAVIGLAILMTNLCLGEVILRTPGNHQLTGYAEKYLGKTGKKLMTFTMIFGIYGALIAYIIGEGEALSAIFGAPPIYFSLMFFAFMAFVIFVGLKMIKRLELVLSFIVLSIVLIISAFSFNRIDIANLMTFNIRNVFIPYGVILFAFLGAAAVPEMKEVLVKQRKKLKKAIIIGSIIPFVAYLIFALVVVGATGLNTTQIATIGLGNLIGDYMIIFGNLFAIFAMGTSFLTLGLALKEMYDYDYNLSKTKAWLLTCFVPLGLFLAGIKSFIATIGVTGSIAGGIEGILIITMFWKAKKLGKRKPEYTLNKTKIVGTLLITVFVLGIIYTIYNLL